MGIANAHYYATRDPLGAAGDFITAPEISQMFGELAGLWLADLWDRSGRQDSHYVELGPGRGTLAADALRAMARAGLRPAVHFVETSPVLRRAQAARVPQASWHDTVDSLPADRPLLIVANEFFDALPIRQFVRTEGAWRERLVDWRDGRFVPVAGERPETETIPAALRTAAEGCLFETAPAGTAIAGPLAERLARQGGAMIVIDYGHAGPALGDTLQAVRRHRTADPFALPGEQDLTAHVDFTPLAAAAVAAGARVHGPVTQGAWLNALGLPARAAALARAAPERADEIEAARARLSEPDGMGRLFKAMAIVAPRWPAPAGFPA